MNNKKRFILPVILTVLSILLTAAGYIFMAKAMEPGVELTEENVSGLAGGQRVTMGVDSREGARISEDKALFALGDVNVVVTGYSSAAGRLGVFDQNGCDQILRGEITSVSGGKAEMRLLPPDRRYRLFFAGSALLLFTALPAALAALLRRRLTRGKTALVMCVFLLLCAAAAAVLLMPAVKMVNSVVKKCDGIYMLDYTADYKLDRYLAANIRNTAELDEWFMDNLTFGVSTETVAAPTGCSSFAASNEYGQHFFGRNYDMAPTDALVIYTKPMDGYSSVGIADLGKLNIGRDGQLDIDSVQGKAALLAAPYCVCDGMNEMGLGVSLLELDEDHVMYDTDAGELLVYTALRAVLDKCADTEEAIEFLGSYDMCSPRSNTYHMFITDRSGRSVIVEWLDGETRVTEDCAVTNFVLYNSDGSGDSDKRYAKMRSAIDDGILTTYEAMSVLEAVSQKTGYTSWSAVYDLDSGEVAVCIDHDYSYEYVFI